MWCFAAVVAQSLRTALGAGSVYVAECDVERSAVLVQARLAVVSPPNYVFKIIISFSSATEKPFLVELSGHFFNFFFGQRIRVENH